MTHAMVDVVVLQQQVQHKEDEKKHLEEIVWLLIHADGHGGVPILPHIHVSPRSNDSLPFIVALSLSKRDHKSEQRICMRYVCSASTAMHKVHMQGQG